MEAGWVSGLLCGAWGIRGSVGCDSVSISQRRTWRKGCPSTRNTAPAMKRGASLTERMAPEF